MPDFVSSENTSPELKARGATIAVLPIGGTEQCGPKLPCTTDSMIAGLCSSYYARAWGAYLAPLLPYNTSQEHAGFAGTLSLSAPLLTQVATELVSELAAQGYNKIIVVSPHGGSLWLPAFIRMINHERRDIIVISSSVGTEPAHQHALKECGWNRPLEMHGGLFTVASMMYLRPDLVRPGPAGGPIDPTMKAFSSYGVWSKIAPDGAWGEFTEADNALDLTKLGKIYWETFLADHSAWLIGHLKAAAALRGIPWEPL